MVAAVAFSSCRDYRRVLLTNAQRFLYVFNVQCMSTRIYTLLTGVYYNECGYEFSITSSRAYIV